MRSSTKAVKIPRALLECLPGRINQLKKEIGSITVNGYLVALIRNDLVNPNPAAAPAFDLASRSLWYQDKIDDELQRSWSRRKEAA